MKINNNNIRAAKRDSLVYRLDRGMNGISYRDFAKIPDDIANRTHEKPQNGVKDKESDCPGASR